MTTGTTTNTMTTSSILSNTVVTHPLGQEKKRKKKEIKAAIMLQNVFRSKFARAVAHRMRRRKLFALAAQSGVLLACEGTEQGLTGWYQQTEESIPVYYEVNERGEWKLIM